MLFDVDDMPVGHNPPVEEENEKVVEDKQGEIQIVDTAAQDNENRNNAVVGKANVGCVQQEDDHERDDHEKEKNRDFFQENNRMPSEAQDSYFFWCKERHDIKIEEVCVEGYIVPMS